MTASDSIHPEHPFVRRPHRTLFVLSFPVLLSLVAEPLTGLVDTAFVARLGVVSMAALGVGTMALSGVFWVFNFLGIGGQTEVAQAFGKQQMDRAARINTLVMLLSAIFGIILTVTGILLMGPVATLLGASGDIHGGAVEYMSVRWFGAPAVLALLAAFGVLRGLQDMKTPLWIAVAVNALNIILDPVLIFGVGPVPSLGIFGAALATTLSQWVGACWAVWIVFVRLGVPSSLGFAEVKPLLKVGRDLFIRTGMLTLFLLLTTRIATRIGAESGAAHQAIRQFWMFTALFLDSFAVTGQSLVGYFIGSGWIKQARRVAAVVCWWSVFTGAALSIVMLVGEGPLSYLLVPPSAMAVFVSPWWVAALFQPLNAVSFATDGINWGTGDFGYLRNAVVVATIAGVVGLQLLNLESPRALMWVWVVVGLWILIRSLFGMLRIWPGVGQAPLGASPRSQ